MTALLIIVIVVVAVVVMEQNSSGGAPGNDFISALSTAIANAEGSNPDINNPGDLTTGDVPAEQTTGVFNSAGVAIIDTIENGWTALRNKLENIFNGNSSVYSPDMTISEFAQTYTGGDNADGWAQSVADSLGVTPDTTLADAQAQYGGN